MYKIILGNTPLKDEDTINKLQADGYVLEYAIPFRDSIYYYFWIYSEEEQKKIAKKFAKASKPKSDVEKPTKRPTATEKKAGRPKKEKK